MDTVARGRLPRAQEICHLLVGELYLPTSVQDHPTQLTAVRLTAGLVPDLSDGLQGLLWINNNRFVFSLSNAYMCQEQS